MAIGTIEVARRENLWTDRLRAYKVLIDGATVGEVRRGESFSTSADAGQHSLQLRIDWGLSETIQVDVREGGTVRVECFSRNPIAVLYYATFGRTRYIGIESTRN